MTQGLGSAAGGPPEPTEVFIACVKHLCLQISSVSGRVTVRRNPPSGGLHGGSFLNGVVEERNRRAVIIPLCLFSLMQMGSREEGGVDIRGDGSLVFMLSSHYLSENVGPVPDQEKVQLGP